MGRVGSSLMMGLLDKAGLNLGAGVSSKPMPINKKGLFEIKEHNHLLGRFYAGYYPETGEPPSLDSVRCIANRHAPFYGDYLSEIAAGVYPLALKSPRCLSLPLAFNLKERFDISIIRLKRNIEEQVHSIEKVWKNHGNDFQKQCSTEDIRAYVKKWIAFSEDIYREYPFESIDCDFNSMIESPENEIKRLSAFIGINISRDYAQSWIDPGLVSKQTKIQTCN